MVYTELTFQVQSRYIQFHTLKIEGAGGLFLLQHDQLNLEPKTGHHALTKAVERLVGET